MRKWLVLASAACALLPVSVFSDETSGLDSQRNHYLQENQSQSPYVYTEIPKNPVAIQKIRTFKDTGLTEKGHTLSPETGLIIQELTSNANHLPIFKLSNGEYVQADKRFIGSDWLFGEVPVSLEYWLQPDFKVYDSPYLHSPISKNLSYKPYQKVHVVAEVKTLAGRYYRLEDGGWLSASDVSVSDNRMAAVQELLTKKYNKSNFSIFVRQLDTQKTAGINEDKQMYAASVAKLVTLYWTQEQLNQKKLANSKKYRYVDAVNHFKGAYDPNGSGSLPKTPDNKDYTVDELVAKTAQQSDNVGANMLGYYVAKSFDSAFYSQLNSITGQPFDMKSRQLSSKQAANILEAMYYQNGDVLNKLSKTDFDNQRIAKNIPVRVAHKIGDAYDFKHDVAIVYADSPFIISIFTDKSSYDDISNIADDVYKILK